MRRFGPPLAALLLLLAGMGPIQAGVVLVDFEQFHDGTNLHGVNLGGVTLINPSGRVEVHDNRFGVGYHSATKAVASPAGLVSVNPLIGVFDDPVRSVSLWGGDQGWSPTEIDSWNLSAYDARVGGNLVGRVNSGSWVGSPYRRLSISGPSILRFEANWTGAQYGIGYDDLQFVTAAPPEPPQPKPEPPPIAPGQQVFRVVALPDTQKYSENNPTADYPGGLAPIFSAQTRWVANRVATHGIRFVTHLGDLVEHGSQLSEWDVARPAMAILDGAGVPYGTSLGNHDLDPRATNYLANFGSQHYQDEPWYGGASPSGRSNYQTFSAGEMDFLFLHVSIDTPAPELEWAQGVLDQHHDKAAVISTHRYLYDYRVVSGRYGDPQVANPLGLPLGPEGVGFEFGGIEQPYDPEGVESEEVFQTFVKTNPNVFMVLCGHSHGEWHQTSTNDRGLPVHEVLADYQDGPNGGNGWLRLMTFDLENNRVEFSTYSPTLGRYRTVEDGFQESIDLVNFYAPQLADALGLPQDQVDALVAWLERDGTGGGRPWGNLWDLSFAGGGRDPSFTLEVDFAAYPNPEPSTFVLLGMGVVVFLAHTWRKRLRR